MSKNIYTLILGVLLSSCSNYLPYSGANENKSITDIPLKPSSGNIDCFLNNQTPAKPFYKVNIVEVTGESNASYDELLISLKNKALGLGYDGIMILEKQQETAYDVVRVGNRNQLATTYQKLMAVGIKYAENINYIDSIVKSTTFEFFSKGEKRSALVNFDFYGNQIPNGDAVANNFYYDNVEPFDVSRHLLSKVKGWQYRVDDVITENVKAFKNEVNEIPVVSASIDESDRNKFYYKIFDPLANKNRKYVLKVERDHTGKIIKKTLFKKEQVIWIEEIKYNNNLVSSFSRFRMDDGKLEPVFTASNQFYSVNDLPKPLSN